MKKTLIALFAMSSLAMATESITLHSVPCGGVGDGYAQVVVLKLTADATRYTTTDLPQTGSVVLESLEFANRNNNDADLNARVAVITDASGTILSLAGNVATESKKHGAGDWGWDYTRRFTTYSSFKTLTDWQPLTLTIGEEYHVYFADADNQLNIMERIMGGGSLTIQTGDFTNGGFTIGNTGASDEVRLLGFASGTGATTVDTVKTYVPIMGMTLTPVTPEPATATLSLLALAGLASRRRRH